MIERLFRLADHHTSVRTEAVAGLVLYPIVAPALVLVGYAFLIT